MYAQIKKHYIFFGFLFFSLCQQAYCPSTQIIPIAKSENLEALIEKYEQIMGSGSTIADLREASDEGVKVIRKQISDFLSKSLNKTIEQLTHPKNPVKTLVQASYHTLTMNIMRGIHALQVQIDCAENQRVRWRDAFLAVEKNLETMFLWCQCLRNLRSSDESNFVEEDDLLAYFNTHLRIQSSKSFDIKKGKKNVAKKAKKDNIMTKVELSKHLVPLLIKTKRLQEKYFKLFNVTEQLDVHEYALLNFFEGALSGNHLSLVYSKVEAILTQQDVVICSEQTKKIYTTEAWERAALINIVNILCRIQFLLTLDRSATARSLDLSAMPVHVQIIQVMRLLGFFIVLKQQNCATFDLVLIPAGKSLFLRLLKPLPHGYNPANIEAWLGRFMDLKAKIPLEIDAVSRPQLAILHHALTQQMSSSIYSFDHINTYMQLSNGLLQFRKQFLPNDLNRTNDEVSGYMYMIFGMAIQKNREKLQEQVNNLSVNEEIKNQLVTIITSLYIATWKVLDLLESNDLSDDICVSNAVKKELVGAPKEFIHATLKKIAIKLRLLSLGIQEIQQEKYCDQTRKLILFHIINLIMERDFFDASLTDGMNCLYRYLFMQLFCSLIKPILSEQKLPKYNEVLNFFKNIKSLPEQDLIEVGNICVDDKFLSKCDVLWKHKLGSTAQALGQYQPLQDQSFLEQITELGIQFTPEEIEVYDSLLNYLCTGHKALCLKAIEEYWKSAEIEALAEKLADLQVVNELASQVDLKPQNNQSFDTDLIEECMDEVSSEVEPVRQTKKNNDTAPKCVTITPEEAKTFIPVVKKNGIKPHDSQAHAQTSQQNRQTCRPLLPRFERSLQRLVAPSEPRSTKGAINRESQTAEIRGGFVKTFVNLQEGVTKNDSSANSFSYKDILKNDFDKNPVNPELHELPAGHLLEKDLAEGSLDQSLAQNDVSVPMDSPGSGAIDLTAQDDSDLTISSSQQSSQARLSLRENIERFLEIFTFFHEELSEIFGAGSSPEEESMQIAFNQLKELLLDGDKHYINHCDQDFISEWVCSKNGQHCPYAPVDLLTSRTRVFFEKLVFIQKQSNQDSLLTMYNTYLPILIRCLSQFLKSPELDLEISSYAGLIIFDQIYTEQMDEALSDCG